MHELQIRTERDVTPDLAAQIEVLDGEALAGLREIEKLAMQPDGDVPLPRRLPFKQIGCLPVFNNRAMADEQAIAALAKVLANGEKLPPLTVLMAGGRAFLVDGHQRLEAHRQHASKNGRGQSFTVPVVYFTGTPADAVFASIERNSQHGVKLTSSERTDAAWKLVLIGEKNRPEIIRATAVTRSWVTKMRSVKRALGEEAADYPRWLHALHEAEGKDMEPLTDEEFTEKKRMRAETIANQITRHIGGQHSDDPELMAMVMDIYMGRRTVDLIQHLSAGRQDELADARELEVNSPF
ncbi:hypothetical protein [Devosia sp. 2618]|uniref:hypothetical protein n=1 Tax=Devosia sp. 2618 TaxID=3156454 RepID=UPI0033947EB2